MSTHGFDPNRLQRLHDVIARNYVESGAIPGSLIMIWREGGLAWLSMSGVTDIASRAPMREDAIFRIFSMTKPITAVALLMLMEEGKIALDDPVSRFLPGFADLGIYAGGLLGSFVTTPSPRPMKVVDLLRHTSGLTYGILNRTSLDAAYRKLKVAEPGMEGGMKGLIGTLEK
ncbi:MAG TPA: serine hydrolase domain-containing protein, partial [Rhizomicrobium sp.]|nr:serine hydrolase domain-containing protein [Rhizomicrobium sp.]